MAIAIDFETYYDKEYSIKTLGPEAYVDHHQFDPYLVSIVGEGIEYVGRPEHFTEWRKLNNADLVAHNARFDLTVFEGAQEKGLIPRTCVPRSWNCTADLSVWNSAPRFLGGASEVLLGEKMDKSIRAKLSKLTYAEACSQGLKEELHQYALDDSKQCLKIWDDYSPDWPLAEQRLSKLNRDSGRRGVFVNRELLDSFLTTLKTVRWESEADIPWDWSGNKTPLSPKALRAACRKAGIPCPASTAQDSDECIIWEDTYGAQYPWVAAMRDWRRSNILLKKLQTMERRLRTDGSFPYLIKYFGGHTGRYSGDGGFNIQNLPRGEVMGVDVRKLFIPAPGKEFLGLDLSQIEARITLWLAQDWDTLKMIEAGHSVYEAHAIQTMGWNPDRKLKVEDPDLYQLAKARVLALGFQCGGERFVAMAKKLCDLDIAPDDASMIVSDFREKNWKIVALWTRLQKWMRESRGGNFELTLPSGRDLIYYNVSTHRHLSAEVVRSIRREKFYGGKLCENAAQATARDVLCDGKLRLLDGGLPPVFHVHDEVTVEVDPGTDPRDIQGEFSRDVDWLPGCPIESEAWMGSHYEK